MVVVAKLLAVMIFKIQAALRFLVAKQSASVLCEDGRPRVLCLPFLPAFYFKVLSPTDYRFLPVVLEVEF